jgi:hypothetical protein
MVLPHISKRTWILMLLASIPMMGGLLAILFIAFVTFFSQPIEVLPFVSKPDADGKLTYRGPTGLN